MRVGFLIVAAAALLSFQVVAKEKAAGELLIGAWKLESWVITDSTGETRYPMTEKPQGRIIYTEGGQMSAQLMHPDPSLPNLAGLSDHEIMGRVQGRFISYYGAWSVDEAAQTVTHHVAGSNIPSVIGTNQARSLEFKGQDQLRLIARLREGVVDEDVGITGTNVLVWRRIK